jgi:hypothetical protein
MHHHHPVDSRPPDYLTVSSSCSSSSIKSRHLSPTVRSRLVLSFFFFFICLGAFGQEKIFDLSRHVKKADALPPFYPTSVNEKQKLKRNFESKNEEKIQKLGRSNDGHLMWWW